MLGETEVHEVEGEVLSTLGEGWREDMCNKFRGYEQGGEVRARRLERGL